MLKIFGIGFHKTATKSLAQALVQMGFKVTGPNSFRDPDIAQTYLSLCRRLSEHFDALQDNPWPLVYKEMDAQWPQARFILTRRESADWYRSQLAHFRGTTTPMRELVYGLARGTQAGTKRITLRGCKQITKPCAPIFSIDLASCWKWISPKAMGGLLYANFWIVTYPSGLFPLKIRPSAADAWPGCSHKKHHADRIRRRRIQITQRGNPWSIWRRGFVWV